MSKHSIGKTIADLRKSKGWTQSELAEKLGVTDKAVSKWESEAGLPDISQLPTMAELFQTTIDYIMTGKIPQAKTTTMSSAELCAKKDDVSLADKAIKDKKIVDYILKYKSLRVFKRLCEIDPKFIERFKLLDAMTLAVLSNSLPSLSGTAYNVDRNCRFTFENTDEIKSLLPIEDKEHFQNTQTEYSCLLPRSFFTMIVTDKRIDENTLNILLSNQNDRKCVWYHAFPYMIEEAYKNGNDKLLRRLLDISAKNNSIAYETINPVYDRQDGYGYVVHYFVIAMRYDLRRAHGLVRILESTIRMAMNNGDFELVDEFNHINKDIENFWRQKFGEDGSASTSHCYVASDDEIRIAKLKLDKSVSEDELRVQSALHCGILKIDELKSIPNLDVIKNALYKYPIHPLELLYRLYKKKEWRLLFEFSIDYGDTCLSDAIIAENADSIEESILSYWQTRSRPYSLSKLYVNDISCSERITKVEEAIDYLNRVRMQFIGNLSNKVEKEKILGELTKDYFDSELSKGHAEMVIIKLCVRMEAILKCNYHYEGDFSEMLSRYCNYQFDSYDDESNNYDPYTPELLNKLRRQRNCIVHSEKAVEPMTEEEIKQCIEYICSMQ